MWIFTKKGFLSIVQHNSIPDFFQVKSRVSGPLEELWPELEIQVIDWADYRFRVDVPKEEALRVIKSLVGSVDYTNFKRECVDQHEYHRSLGSVWNVMYNFQMRMEE